MYPKAYITYLIHFHCDRDYFECHEILEEHWKQEINAHKKHYWVGMIQIAVALYHHRRGNFAGAKRMITSAISIIKEEKEAVSSLGIDSEKLVEILEIRLSEILKNEPYSSINLPIVDDDLISICQSISNKIGKKWGIHSDLTNEYVVHKHKLRDRSDVIAEREKQKQLRKKGKD